MAIINKNRHDITEILLKPESGVKYNEIIVLYCKSFLTVILVLLWQISVDLALLHIAR